MSQQNNGSSEGDQFKQLLDNYMKNMTPEERKAFTENLSKSVNSENSQTPKTARDRLREKREMARFNRLPKFAQNKIQQKYKDIMTQPAHDHQSCGDHCNHDHEKDTNNNDSHK